MVPNAATVYWPVNIYVGHPCLDIPPIVRGEYFDLSHRLLYKRFEFFEILKKYRMLQLYIDLWTYMCLDIPPIVHGEDFDLSLCYLIVYYLFYIISIIYLFSTIIIVIFLIILFILFIILLFNTL